MEGITGYIYRNAYEDYFGGIDRYYSPFVVTRDGGIMKNKEKNDIPCLPPIFLLYLRPAPLLQIFLRHIFRNLLITQNRKGILMVCGNMVEDNFILGLVSNSVSVAGYKAYSKMAIMMDDGLFEALFLFHDFGNL